MASHRSGDPVLQLWPSMTGELQGRLLGAHQKHGKLSVKKVLGTLRGSSPAIARTVAIVGRSSEVLSKSDSSAPALQSAVTVVAHTHPKFKCSQYVSQTCKSLLESGKEKVTCEDFFLELVGSGPSPLLLQWQEDGFDANTIRSIYQREKAGRGVESHSIIPSPHPSQTASETWEVKDIFISYGREVATNVFINRIKCDLERAGYTTWLDCEDIPGGAEWHAVIGEGVRHCKALVAIITHKYVSSRFCKNELFMADSAQKAIFPVFLEDVDVSLVDAGVVYTISSINWIRVTGGEGGYREAVAKLLQGMRDKGIAPSLAQHTKDIAPSGSRHEPDVSPEKPRQSSKPLKSYSVEEVCAFISELELDPSPFRENAVAGEDLLELTDDDMKTELGLKPLQIRKLRRKMKDRVEY